MPRPRRKGEPVSEYLTRLTAGDPLRIRVHPDYIDPEGNIIVKPVLICGRDTSDDYRPARMDTAGRIDTIGHVPEYQAQAVLYEAPPVSGTEYTIIDTTEYVRLWSVAAKCNWTVQPTPLEVRIYIDGQTITMSKGNPATATYYTPELQAATPDTAVNARNADLYDRKGMFLEGRSVKVTAEITGGTVSRLDAYVRYSIW